MGPRAQGEVHEDGPPAKTRDRELTERRIVEATFEMFRSDGVLAGLNLRDVASKAGVARGNIYNYFGNRRQLLRRALGIRVTELDDYRGVSTLPFVRRKMRLFGGDADELQAVELTALLTIDGDDEVTPMPFFDQAMERMNADLDGGHIHPDYGEDLEALHIAIHASIRGYNLFRTAYARQLGVSTNELDERVGPMFEDWLNKIALPQSGSNADPSGSGS